VSANVAGVAIGAVLIGLSSYVPTYAQGVVGVGAVLAGFAMATMSIGWPLASSQAARLYMRIDFRDTAIVGSAFTIAGTALFAFWVVEDSGLWRVATASFVTGVGLGFASISMLVAVQSVVGWERRGVVTGSAMFCRSIGSALGIAVFGSIANTTLGDWFRHPPAALADRLPRSVDTAALAFSDDHGDAAVVAYTRDALYAAMHHVFIALLVVGVVGLAMQLLMPRRIRPLTLSDDAAEA
jgi:MFS family permease